MAELRKETLNAIIEKLDELGRNACAYEYGLPIYEPNMSQMREAIREIIEAEER
jgi:hypothetical protein